MLCARHVCNYVSRWHVTQRRGFCEATLQVCVDACCAHVMCLSMYHVGACHLRDKLPHTHRMHARILCSRYATHWPTPPLPHIQAHDMPVSTLLAMDEKVVSGSWDCSIAFWDVNVDRQ